MAESEKELSPEAGHYLHVFKCSLPLQVRLHEIVRALGSTDKLVCLDIGSPNPVFSYHLRKRGGEWHSVVANPAQQSAAGVVLGDNVYQMDGTALPFKKAFFDVMVVVDFFERAASDEAFIEECHRVLKPDGRLIVTVRHTKQWTLLRPLQRMLGVTSESTGMVRPGYTESQLFSILKHGFDVHNMHSFSRFFVELTDTLLTFAMGNARAEGTSSEKKIRRLYSLAYVPFRLAFQLDMLLFFSRGHTLMATSKRRAWRPRTTPVLIDGRSISEAVLMQAPR